MKNEESRSQHGAATPALERWRDLSFDVGKALLAWYQTTTHEGLDHPEEQAAFSVLLDEAGDDLLGLLTAVLADEMTITLPEEIGNDALKGQVFDKIDSAYLANWRELDTDALTQFLRIAAMYRNEEWCGWNINDWSPELLKQMYRVNAGLPIDVSASGTPEAEAYPTAATA